jgi:aminopeptidase N
MDDIMRYSAELLGGAPYPSAALAVVEAELPGGHSPPYFVMLNSPITTTNVSWRNDPAAFQGFPEFFLAHELAHQWWGHAIGWKNYREQWISEGFAQYFAALYAQRSRGERIFQDMLRQFRRWSLDESDKGPVHLGQRLGQIEGGQRVYRALVYNKGAAVLHMLRRMIGDDAFFRGLRRFYRTHLFQTAGTGDLLRAMEAEAKRPLDRFFDQWILGTSIPRVSVRSSIQPGVVVIRLTQDGDETFQLPVTVTLVHADGSMTDEVVVMTERNLEHRIQTDKAVRQVRVNRDSGALAEFS